MVLLATVDELEKPAMMHNQLIATELQTTPGEGSWWDYFIKTLDILSADDARRMLGIPVLADRGEVRQDDIAVFPMDVGAVAGDPGGEVVGVVATDQGYIVTLILGPLAPPVPSVVADGQHPLRPRHDLALMPLADDVVDVLGPMPPILGHGENSAVRCGPPGPEARIPSGKFELSSNPAVRCGLPGAGGRGGQASGARAGRPSL